MFLRICGTEWRFYFVVGIGDISCKLMPWYLWFNYASYCHLAYHGFWDCLLQCTLIVHAGQCVCFLSDCCILCRVFWNVGVPDFSFNYDSTDTQLRGNLGERFLSGKPVVGRQWGNLGDRFSCIHCWILEYTGDGITIFLCAHQKEVGKKAKSSARSLIAMDARKATLCCFLLLALVLHGNLASAETCGTNISGCPWCSKSICKAACWATGKLYRAHVKGYKLSGSGIKRKCYCYMCQDD